MVKIKNRFTGDVIFTYDGANLRYANMYEANLRGANLRYANMYEANLRGANLYEADLYEADLYAANLRYANLRGANLRGANMYEVDLYEADLYEANLRYANLRGAKNAPLIISGLDWFVQISGTGWMRIGCQRHSISEWESFTDTVIDQMATGAIKFWQTHKQMLMALCNSYVHKD